MANYVFMEYSYFHLRVPIAFQRPVPFEGFFRPGFALNIGLLLWSVCGGFLLYFLTCNFLTLLVKPSWEEPIRTITDLLERDMGLILWAYQGYYRKVMRNSHVEQYNKESFIIQKSQNLELFSKRRQSKEKRYSSHLSNSQLFSIVETNVRSVLRSHVWLLRQFSNFFSRMNWDHLVNFYFAWVTFHYLPGWLGQCWKCCSCFDRRMLNSDGLDCLNLWDAKSFLP